MLHGLPVEDSNVEATLTMQLDIEESTPASDMTCHKVSNRAILPIEIPQVGCLSRSGVIKSVLRDGLICTQKWIEHVMSN